MSTTQKNVEITCSVWHHPNICSMQGFSTVTHSAYQKPACHGATVHIYPFFIFYFVHWGTYESRFRAWRWQLCGSHYTLLHLSGSTLPTLSKMKIAFPQGKLVFCLLIKEKYNSLWGNISHRNWNRNFCGRDGLPQNICYFNFSDLSRFKTIVFSSIHQW